MIHRLRMWETLRALHERELPPHRREAVLEHVRRCRACSDDLRRMEETDRLLAGGAPPVQMLPADESRRVLNQALVRSGVLKKRLDWRRSGSMYGLAALALAFVFGGFRADPGSRQAVTAAVPAPRSASATGLAAQIHPPEVQTAEGPDARTVRRRRRRHSGLLLARAIRHRRRPGAPAAAAGVRGLAGAPKRPTPAEASGAVMLVVVTAGGTQPVVTVDHAPDDSPGYARVAVVKPEADGGATVTQCTVSSDLPAAEISLVKVMPGEQFRAEGGNQ